MGSFVVAAYAKHDITRLHQGTMVVTEIAGLSSTARCIVLGIKIKHYFFTLELAQSDFVTVLIRSGKVGCFVANFQFGLHECGHYAGKGKTCCEKCSV